MHTPLLLVPGPVPLHPRVQEELAKPALPHYGPAWVEAYSEVERLLRYVWAAPKAKVFPVLGPGHAGIEVLAHTFVRRGDRAVVVDNGFFGDRMREVLEAHHARVDVVRSPWGHGPDIAGVRKALREPARVVVIVHNETSTGVTNPLAEVVEAAHEKDAFVFADAVSSLAGLPLPFAELGLDAAFSASQKCLAAPAGIAPVAVAPALWEAADPDDADGWYFNLFTWDRYEREWGDWHPSPTTISSNLFLAVRRALQLVKEEGLEARIARHAKIAKRLRAGLAVLGFRPVAAEPLLSNTVTCASPPREVDPGKFIARLRDEHDVYISGGLGSLRGKTIRVGSMGTQAEPEVVDAFLSAAKACL
jgi:alanine-glyoxylate transaminase/serine-glyoxylate transaminase/serine-pyruvate transaminase